MWLSEQLLFEISSGKLDWMRTRHQEPPRALES